MKWGRTKFLTKTAITVLLALNVSQKLWAWEFLRKEGTCSKTKKRCISTLGNASSKGDACCDPYSPEVEVCTQNNSCQGGKIYHWTKDKFPLNWYVNLNGMPGKSGFKYYSAQELIEIFKKAWKAWSTPLCTKFKESYRGQTKNRFEIGDQKLVIYLPTRQEWYNMGQDENTLAISRPVANSKGELLDADIALSPRSYLSPWEKSANPSIDLTAVLAHEIGHSLGFAHTPHKTLMYYANLPGKFKGLSRDEIDGLCQIYPKEDCKTDRDCGTCFKCESKRCQLKQVRPIDRFCKPCQLSNQCGKNGLCVYTPEGKRCLQECRENPCCPPGFHCRELSFGLKLCWPNSGGCPPIKCQTNRECGPGEECKNKSCRPKPVPPSPNLCRELKPNEKCSADETKIKFPDGKYRCTMACREGIFCPKGYTCKILQGKRLCVPEDWICPCETPSDCGENEVCQKDKCRPKKCGFQCLCSEKAPCPSGYSCISLGHYGVCLQLCGESALFTKDQPGSPCSESGICKEKSRCFATSPPLCLIPCGRDLDCTENGGKCTYFGNSGFCLCRDDRDCNYQKTGKLCNRTFLKNWGLGACAKPAVKLSRCPDGFSCRKEGGLGLCIPTPRDVGKPCGGLFTCKDGLICVSTEGDRRGETKPLCLELCTKGQNCRRGGICQLRLSDGSMACSCRGDKECLLGQTCQIKGSGIAYCAGRIAESCGDQKCSSERGENCLNCPDDCRCKSGYYK